MTKKKTSYLPDIVPLIEQMDEKDQIKTFRDLMCYDEVLIKKTYNKDGTLTRVEHLSPDYIEFYSSQDQGGN